VIAMSDILLELKNINMHFSKTSGIFSKEKRLHVLKNVNLNLEYGEILAVVGESGCGKTTIGRIITGLLRPTSGDLIFEDKNVYNLFRTGDHNYRESVQFIQQDSYAALNPVKTIRQSLSAPIQAHNKKISKMEIAQKVKNLLEDVGLIPASQFINKYPHQMSGGQRQRVLMARALTQNPKVIVADEPVSMIDVSLRLSILNLMTKLNKERNISFVYITHDLGTARYIASRGRIAVMYLGEIVELGKVNDIIDDPKHPYTQALLSAVPIPNPILARKENTIKIRSMDLMDLEHRQTGCSFYDRCPYRTEECKEGNIPYLRYENQEVKCINMKSIPKFTGVYKE
jgi:oligopeptide/dipeptide ABC transporter ATP-binding protein